MKRKKLIKTVKNLKMHCFKHDECKGCILSKEGGGCVLCEDLPLYWRIPKK